MSAVRRVPATRSDEDLGIGLTAHGVSRSSRPFLRFSVGWEFDYEPHHWRSRVFTRTREIASTLPLVLLNQLCLRLNLTLQPDTIRDSCNLYNLVGILHADT